MKKKIKKKYIDCKKRLAKYECLCGLKFCKKCSDDGEYCPADEGIEHNVSKISTKK